MNSTLTGAGAGAKSNRSTLSEHAVRRQFSRRAQRITEGDFLLREIERRMFERLELIKLAPVTVLDIGCGRGVGLGHLTRRYPKARVIGLDFALPMLAAQAGKPGLFGRVTRPWRQGFGRSGPQRLGANALRLPLANSSIDLLWSNLCWHWLTDPMAALSDWYRVVRPRGLLMFSSFGVDTGCELARLGWPLLEFPDMHDIGDALSKNGFADPVMDTERLTLEYRDPIKLIRELSALGGNALAGRAARLWPRAALIEWQNRLQAAMNSQGGRLAITIEVIYGHAWCGERKRLPDGLAPVNWVSQSVPRLNK